MIDFKNKDELPTSVVICGSLAAIVIAAGWILFVPKPKAPSAIQNIQEKAKITATDKLVESEMVSVKQRLANYTWSGTPEDIGPVALRQVNSMLQARHLKLVGFHAEKILEEPNITLVPFLVSVDGGFPNVMAFTRDLEQPGTKLVVNEFQVSNADQSSDKVTASIGITAYQLPQPASASSTAPPAGKKQAPMVKKNA